MPREKVLSVSIHDCRVDTFRAGGKGGQHQNTTDSGVRVVHEPSGAVGESREERSQRQNKKTAFRRMVQHPKFKLWIDMQLGRYIILEEKLKQELARGDTIRTEVRVGGKWKIVDPADLTGHRQS